MEEKRNDSKDIVIEQWHKREENRRKEWLKSPERKRLHKLYKRLHKQFIKHYEREKIDENSPQPLNSNTFCLTL